MSLVLPYDDLIMEHIRHARNFRAPEAAVAVRGLNPLCGDELTVYVRVEGGVIVDAAFQCECCGISMASASILTERVARVPVAAASAMLDEFISGLAAGALPAGAAAGPLALLEAARRYPVRRRCALLPWVVLKNALEGRSDPVYVR